MSFLGLQAGTFSSLQLDSERVADLVSYPVLMVPK